RSPGPGKPAEPHARSRLPDLRAADGGHGHRRGDGDVDFAGHNDEGESKGEQPNEDVGGREVEEVGTAQEEARERPAPDAAAHDQHDQERFPARKHALGHDGRLRQGAASWLRMRRASARRCRRNASCRRCLKIASNVTATTIAVPSKKIFQNSEIRSSVKPLSIVATRSAPSVAPSTVPDPPKTLTPPITTAVTTSSSKLRPATASTLANRAANRKPPSPASAPLIRKAVITRRPTRIPASRAASGLEPIT